MVEIQSGIEDSISFMEVVPLGVQRSQFEVHAGVEGQEPGLLLPPPDAIDAILIRREHFPQIEGVCPGLGWGGEIGHAVGDATFKPLVGIDRQHPPGAEFDCLLDQRPAPQRFAAERRPTGSVIIRDPTVDHRFDVRDKIGNEVKVVTERENSKDSRTTQAPAARRQGAGLHKDVDHRLSLQPIRPCAGGHYPLGSFKQMREGT
jgi:hypothetical protein